jgi:hypothetical protein
LADPLTRTLHTPYRWGDAPSEAQLHDLEVKRRLLRYRLIAEHEDPVRRAALIDAETEMCRRDVVYTAEQWGWTYDPREPNQERRAKPFVPWPKQVELLRWIRAQAIAGRIALTAKGRALGVTWLHVLEDLHSMRFSYGHRSKWGSRKEELLDGDEDTVFGMLRFLIANLPTFLRPGGLADKRLSVTCRETEGQITGESTNAGFARGGRRSTITLDEFAHVDPGLADRIWGAVQTVARSVRVVSTHNGPGTVFARLAATLPPDCVRVLDWQADPRRPAHFRELCLLDGMTPELFSQEHEAKAVTLATGKMYKGPLIDAATETRADIDSIAYDESTHEWAQLIATEDIRRRGGIVGGWDFGSGPSLLVCLKAIVEPGASWCLWIDHEHVWSQTSWERAAYDVLAHDSEVYGWQARWHFGDPSGINRESNQENWQSNLRQGGVPLTCLAAEYNTKDGQEWMIKQVQGMIDRRRLRVHRRCTYLWSVLNNWTRDIPQGADPNLLNKAYIAPRHDFYSHGGWALAYLVQGAVISMIAAHDRGMDDLGSLPPAPGGEIAGMLAIGG